MLPEIDFLPKSYRQDRLQGRRKKWRTGIVIVFVSLVALGMFAQHRTHKQLAASQSWLQARADRMMSQLESDGELYAEIRELDAKANLLTKLRVRVAASRILMDVTNSLPDSVSLTQFRLTTETAATRDTDKNKKKKNAKEPVVKMSPVFEDLSKLSEMQEQRFQSVAIHGIAPDDGSVSTYLENLQNTRSFDEVKLLYTDRYPFQEYELRKFSIELRVRKPGLQFPSEQPSHSTRGQVDGDPGAPSEGTQS